MIAIQTANLTKKYGDIIAINGVDLEVEAGEIVGCLGPERSGKTTLLRLLTGLVRPTLGDSTVLGLSSVKESRKLRAKSGIVTDTAACIGSMSALENLLMFASMYGMRKEQARTHAAQLLKKLDLWNARDRKVYTFSTEMCRRLSLARALVHHPQIVFSDGLPGGEQAVSDAMVLRTLSDYAKETGATVLLCTDHLESAEEICTSFAVLEHGFLRASGDLSMLTAASELTPMAVIRVSDTQKMPEDFTLHDGAWEKPIESEADMPELISGLVRENVGIYEASVCTPTLQDVYYAFVKSRERRHRMKKLFYKLFSKAERALMMKDLSALCRRRLILTLLIALPLVLRWRSRFCSCLFPLWFHRNPLVWSSLKTCSITFRRGRTSARRCSTFSRRLSRRCCLCSFRFYRQSLRLRTRLRASGHTAQWKRFCLRRSACAAFCR